MLLLADYILNKMYSVVIILFMFNVVQSMPVESTKIVESNVRGVQISSDSDEIIQLFVELKFI